MRGKSCQANAPPLNSLPSSDIGNFAAPPGHIDRGGEEPYPEETKRVLLIASNGPPMAEEPKKAATPAKKKTSPGEFINQVKSETSKVVWPSREETVRTAIFVFILVVILSLFFLGVDSLFGWVVQQLLALL